MKWVDGMEYPQTLDWEGIGWDHGFVPAIIIAPHRLFRVGDVVIPHLLNGGGERQPVMGVSSKGLRVTYLYVQYARYTNGGDTGPYDREHKRPRWQWNERAERRRDLKSVQVDGKHMRFLEVPGHLQDRLVDDPAVRGYVLEAVRALHAARRVSADSPSPSHAKEPTT